MKPESHNAAKFQFVREKVNYCGSQMTKDGNITDDQKITAIGNFPRPANITDLRSFIGLVNQLGGFSSDVAAAARPLRDLLKQHQIWNWNEHHETTFSRV